MLKQRVITALLLGSLFLSGLFLLSPQVMALILALVVVYAGWEWSDMAGMPNRFWRFFYTAFIFVALFVVAQLLGFSLQFTPNIEVARVFLISGCLWWLVAAFLVRGYPGNESLWGSCWMRSLMGALVLVPAWVAIVVLLHMPNGNRILLLAILIVVLADVGAYFAGRRFGKHKLAPGVSPGKTWEGFFGGLLANFLLTLILGLALNMQAVEWGWLLAAITVTSFASVLGDLLESMVKRHRGVKDSGTILPGHGGILDRVDSITAALPVFTLFLLLINLSL